MLTLPVDEWIGNAAAVVSGVWGAVSKRSAQSGYSRTAIYQHAERVVEAVANEQATGISYEALWAENERLRAETEALWQVWSETEELSESKQREFASTGAAMGLSLTQIVILLAIVLPRRMAPSRATVGRWVRQSEAQASRLLRVLDQACQRFVLVLCLDEIFFHRVPILMAVEPVSLAWLAGQRGPDRTGASWCGVIENWPDLEHVVADGGSGLERGVKLANARRQTQVSEAEAAPKEAITMGLDVFHSQREMARVQQRQWKQAERALAAASEADAKLAKLKRQGGDPRGVASHAARVWRQAEQSFDEAVQSDALVKQVEAALCWFDASGRLLSRSEAREQLDKASDQLVGSQWSKVRRLLEDERTLSHLDRLEAQLTEIAPQLILRESLTRIWFFREQLNHVKLDKRDQLRSWMVMEQVLCRRLCPDWKAIYIEVDKQLRQAVRASSAVEGVNSVVRMQQGRHRHVSQGMLDLKRLYWNCRVFREGKRKRRSPYELLGLKLPTSDWWQLLQMDPQEVEQILLTQ